MSRAGILVAAPGGTSERGGMGRLARGVVRHWRCESLQPPLQVVDPYGPNVAALSPFFLARACAQIVASRLAGRAALLHVHMASRGSVLRKAVIVGLGRALGLPVVLHMHNSQHFLELYARLPATVRRLAAAVLGSADRIVVLGRLWLEPTAVALGVPVERVRVLVNGVEDRPGPPRSGRAECRILFLGRLEPGKGIPELLDAMAGPALKGAAWRACLVGRGEVAGVRKRVRELGLEGQVEVPGWMEQDAVGRLLAESDVLVLPSHDEGLSIALLEGMAAGLALVTTPVGATTEVVRDRHEALIVPVGDATALGIALGELVRDPALRRALGTSARRRFEQGLDVATHCRGLLQLYRELLPAGVVSSDSVAQRSMDRTAQAKKTDG